MNKLGILFAFVTFLFAGCKENQPTQFDVVKSNAEAYIKEKMNDPSSYEFVNLVLIDSTTYKDNIEYRLNLFNNRLTGAISEVERLERYKIELPSLYDENRLNDEKVEIQKK